MNTATVVTAENLPPMIYKEEPVVSTRLLADVYGTDQHHIRQNFNRNKNRFTEGTHFFFVEGRELKGLKSDDSLSYAVPKTINKLTLWTERGAVRHAKMLETDHAWDVFEQLENCYFDKYQFKAKPTAQLPAPTNLTPEQQHAAKKQVETLARESELMPRLAFSRIWNDVKDHFKVATYKDIPSSKFPELMRLLGAPVETKPESTDVVVSGEVTVNAKALKGTLGMISLMKERRADLFKAHAKLIDSFDSHHHAIAEMDEAFARMHDVLADLPAHAHSLYRAV